MPCQQFSLTALSKLPFKNPQIMAVQSASHRAFLKHLKALESTTTDPGHLATQLRAENLIDQLAQERAQLLTLAPLERSRELLHKLEGKIQTDEGAFDKFLSIMDRDPTMEEICGKLKDTKGIIL